MGENVGWGVSTSGDIDRGLDIGVAEAMRDWMQGQAYNGILASGDTVNLYREILRSQRLQSRPGRTQRAGTHLGARP